MGVTLTNDMINGAIATQEKYGVPASVTLAQIKLESGGSNPGGLSTLAYNDNNLFGIKAGSGWDGKTSTYKTTEYGSNGYYTTSASFRSYNNVGESIDDHGKLLSSPLYANKTNGVTNVEDYVKAIAGTYATDPNYASKLLNIINSDNLKQYDSGNYTSVLNNKQSTGTKSTGSTSTGGTSTGFSVQSLTISIGEIVKNMIRKMIEDILPKVTLFLAVVFLVVVAVVLFMNAFNIELPSKTDIAKKVVKEVVA